MSKGKPGDVAVATYDGKTLVYLWTENRYDATVPPRWQSQDGSHSFDFWAADSVTYLGNLLPIEEPTGLGAVVEDREGVKWSRSHTGHWGCDHTALAEWDQVAAVTILAPGIPR